MKPKTKKTLRLILGILLLASLFFYGRNQQAQSDPQGVLTLSTAGPDTSESAAPRIDESGQYTQKEEVAAYIHAYGRLPDNFVTKAEAREKGWSGGSLEGYFPGCSIGGDKFGNREGLLPAENGRQYYECDIDTAGKSQRGAERIVFSNDGLIYYTDDHYESFTLLYGED